MAFRSHFKVIRDYVV